MDIKRKKNLTYFTMAVFFFLGGVEYAVILPTLWLYISESFGAQEYMLGIILSAFSFSGLISGPLMGRWSDYTRQTKWVLVFANLWEVAGSVMYFLGINSWFLVAARLVAGVGTGVGSAIIADLTRVTSTEERTSVLAVFMAIRQVGLLIGPAFNLFLMHLDVNIGRFPLNKYTAPGAFMAVIWLLYELLAIFMFWDLPSLNRDQQEIVTKEQIAYSRDGESEVPPDQPSPSLLDTSTESGAPILTPIVSPAPSSSASIPRRPSSVDLLLTSSNEMIESAERFICMDTNCQSPISECLSPVHEIQIGGQSRDEVGLTHPHVNSTPPGMSGGHYGSLTTTTHGYDSLCHHGNRSSADCDQYSVPLLQTDSVNGWRYYYHEFFRPEVIVILGTVFVSFFNQVALETMVTPLTKRLLNFNELENSILYCAAGIEIMIVFALIRCLSRRFSDRSLLLLGFIIETTTIALLLWFIPQAKPHDQRSNLPWLMLGLVLDIAGLPFLVVISASLYSKITQERTQGFAQGIRRMFGGLGCIMGPLWASSLLDTPRRMYIMLGVMLAINLTILVLLLCSYASLKGSLIHSNVLPETSLENSKMGIHPDSNERTQLLHSTA